MIAVYAGLSSVLWTVSPPMTLRKSVTAAKDSRDRRDLQDRGSTKIICDNVLCNCIQTLLRGLFTTKVWSQQGLRGEKGREGPPGPDGKPVSKTPYIQDIASFFRSRQSMWMRFLKCVCLLNKGTAGFKRRARRSRNTWRKGKMLLQFKTIHCKKQKQQQKSCCFYRKQTGICGCQNNCVKIQ